MHSLNECCIQSEKNVTNQTDITLTDELCKLFCRRDNYDNEDTYCVHRSQINYPTLQHSTRNVTVFVDTSDVPCFPPVFLVDIKYKLN